jgi:hypothetical protein
MMLTHYNEITLHVKEDKLNAAYEGIFKKRKIIGKSYLNVIRSNELIILQDYSK